MENNSANTMTENSGKKKKRKILIIVLIVIIAAAATFAGWNIYQMKQIDNIAPTVMTDQVTRKTLTSSIAATGTIKSKTVTDVIPGGVGETGLKVTGVNVQVGDVVNEGDVLCTFDVSTAKEQLADVKDAQAQAEEAEAAGIKSAQRAYDQAVSSKEKQLAAAQAEIDAAQASVNEAQTQLDSLPGKIEAAKTVLRQANDALQKAEESGDDTAIKAAQAGVNEAQDALDLLTDPQNEQTLKEAVASAEAAYRQANTAYQSTADAADEAIASAEDALDAAYRGSDAGTDSSTKAQIRSLQEAIDGESLKSPVSGTVTAVNITADGYYTGGAVVTIQDTENLYVEASIKETDIPDVKEGMEVLIKTEATGDEELKGKVTNVAPTAGSGTSLSADTAEAALSGGTASSGTGYQVEIDLLQSNERLRIDMTAKLSLIKEQKKNILVVPYDAVFTDENGNKTLHVISDDGYQEVQVKTGMESGYYVEILPAPGIENGTEIEMPQTGDDSLTEMDPAGGL